MEQNPMKPIDPNEAIAIVGIGSVMPGSLDASGFWKSQVPVDTEIIGDKANATRPEIEQVMIANNREVPDPQFELDLYVIRRRIENRVAKEGIQGFYICSLSCRSVIYKGSDAWVRSFVPSSHRTSIHSTKTPSGEVVQDSTRPL